MGIGLMWQDLIVAVCSGSAPGLSPVGHVRLTQGSILIECLLLMQMSRRVNPDTRERNKVICQIYIIHDITTVSKLNICVILEIVFLL